MVLDIYSDFINNFSLSMETAKQASKNKSSFADFLRIKQINSSDRLSFFGLMVKPIQRFPQFILMLQDLLKYTPPGHHDRMSLQLALTQLESLAETLNERKREAEQHHAVREVLKHLGKFSFKASTDRNHFLLRQDDVLQLQLDQNGLLVKSKQRRLFLLNDLLLSVAVTTRNSDGIANGERLSQKLKWAVPLQDVDIYDDLNMSTKSLKMFYSKSKHANHNVDNESEAQSEQTLYEELRDLIHDKDIITRIESLVSSLRRPYKDFNINVTQRVSSSIHETIQQKCEEINQMESSCLQLAIPLKSKSSKEVFCFQMCSPAAKRDWITDLRLAKLALDSNNLPAWDMPDPDKRPSSKMPLFVKNFPVFQTSCSSEVTCGCYYVANSCSVSQHYLWICSSDGINSHIVVMAVQSTHLCQVAVYHLSEMKIISVEAVPGMTTVSKACSPEKSMSSDSVLSTETVWLGTENQKVIVLEGSCPEKWEEIGSTVTSACILQIKYHLDRVYVGIANGSVLIFNRSSDGQWQLETPTNLVLSQDPVACLLPVGLNLYCASGSKIWVVDSLTAEVQRNYPVQHDDSHAYLLAHSGTGIWMALKDSATICLYHTETFQHLQDINIAANVIHILNGKDKEKASQAVHVTSLLASKGLLWVGTNVGIVLTVPLPRLEGVPIITGRVSLAFHGHQGPVNLLLSLQPKSVSFPFLSTPIGISPTVNNLNECKDLSPQSLATKQISDSALMSPSSNKRFEAKVDVGYIHVSGAKTLPHNQSLCSHVTPLNNVEEASDVYGLYADLMNVRDYEKDSDGKLYERLNHSDPELMHLNLDKKVQEKSSRPRSWDLSTMAVSEDSDSASTATSTATTPSRNSATEEPVQRHSEDFRCLPTHITLRREISKSNKKTDSTPKTILMLTGGCDYIHWRKPEKIPKQYLDANVIIWEVKI